MENQTTTSTPITTTTLRPHAGGREDCWSEGATETLIEAWGDRYMKLNRGHLRQKEWREVADAVNSRQNGVKPQRTDIQCKNRVDTLKKKYKLEKTKTKTPLSKWPFYNRLDYLIGSNGSNSPSNRKSTTITLSVKCSPSTNAKFGGVVYSGGSSRLNSSGSNESSRGVEEDDVQVESGDRKQRMEFVNLSVETGAYKELARAILRFGEIYERIESSKQQQIFELEKQRMEFTNDLEVQRMNMIMEAQLQLARSKRPTKGPPSAGKK